MKGKTSIVFLLLFFIFLSPQIEADNCLNNYEMGNLLFEMNLYDKALECYNVSENNEAIIKKVQILLEKENSKKAITELNEYIENNDKYNNNVYFWLSRSYLINNDLEKAEKYAIKFNQSQNNNPDGYILLGDVYYKNNMIKKAKLEYQKAINLSPDYAIARYRLWNISTEKENIENWLKRYPEDNKARLLLSNYYKKTKENKISELQKLLGKGVNINKYIAEDLFYSGKLEEASLYYIKYLQQEPKNLEAVSNLIKIYLRMGKVKKADSIMESYPSTYDNLLLKALREKVQGNLDDAIFYYWEYINKNKKDADAYIGVAYTYLAKGKYELAIRDFKSAIYISPYYKDAFLGLLESLERENRYKEIIYWTSIATKRFTDNKKILLYRARAFMQEQKIDSALNILDNIDHNEINSFKEVQKIKIISHIKNDDFKKAIIETEKLVNKIENDKLDYYKVLFLLYKKLGMKYNSEIYREKIKLYNDNWNINDYNSDFIINLIN